MTQTYEGNGEHTVHLDSGKTLILHETELFELSGSNVSRQSFDEQTYAISSAKSIVEDLHGALKELLPSDTVSSIKSLVFEIDEVLTVAKRQSLDI